MTIKNKITKERPVEKERNKGRTTEIMKDIKNEYTYIKHNI